MPPASAPPDGIAAQWPARCPGCGAAMGVLPLLSVAAGVGALDCPACGAAWSAREGIWRLISADDVARSGAFVAEYTAVRHAEGRAAMTPSQRLALPYGLASTPLAWQWRVRAGG